MACRWFHQHCENYFLRIWEERQNGTFRPGTTVPMSDDMLLGAYATQDQPHWLAEGWSLNARFFVEEVDKGAWPFVSSRLGTLLLVKLLDLGQNTVKVILGQEQDYLSDWSGWVGLEGEWALLLLQSPVVCRQASICKSQIWLQLMKYACKTDQAS